MKSNEKEVKSNIKNRKLCNLLPKAGIILGITTILSFGIGLGFNVYANAKIDQSINELENYDKYENYLNSVKEDAKKQYENGEISKEYYTAYDSILNLKEKDIAKTFATEKELKEIEKFENIGSSSSKTMALSFLNGSIAFVGASFSELIQDFKKKRKVKKENENISVSTDEEEFNYQNL